MGTFYITDDLMTDGVRNFYSGYGTLSFDQATVPIQFGYSVEQEVYYFAPAGVSDPLHNGDWGYANKIILSPQDDHFQIGLEAPIEEVWGGAGNDYIFDGDDTSGSSLYGGDGNDILILEFAPKNGRDHLVGGNGNDVLVGNGNAEMSGGAGTDRFVLASGTRGAFITDLDPATESVDLWPALSNNHDYFATFSQAVAAGVLRVDHGPGGYTYIYYKSGISPAAQEYLLAYTKLPISADQYDKVFTTTFARSWDNKFDKVLDGTANPARDHLVGGREKDVFIMGDTDEATANGGNDRFVLTNLTGASAFITDLTDRHDNTIDLNVVDMGKALYDRGYSYDTFSEAQAAGTLKAVVDHGYTNLYFDADGDHLAEHEFAHIKGVSVVPLDNILLVAPAKSYLDLAVR